MPTIKLQKFLAHAGIASRRASESLIEDGLVAVNNQVAHLGQRVDPDKDQITYKGKPISTLENSELKYFLINKPRGIVTTTDDELGRDNVLSLLPKKITSNYRLYPVGRLDQESEGLILLTNDGDWTHYLTHPQHMIDKTYLVFPNRPLSEKAFEHLSSGVKLKDGFAQPTLISQEDPRELQESWPETLPKDYLDQDFWLKITLKEGRNHQVRRMLRRVGYETKRLIRIKFGPYSIETLKDQAWIEV